MFNTILLMFARILASHHGGGGAVGDGEGSILVVLRRGGINEHYLSENNLKSPLIRHFASEMPPSPPRGRL